MDDRMRRLSSHAVHLPTSQARARKRKDQVQRHSERMSTYKNATVDMLNGTKVTCAVMNIDARGALLRFAGNIVMPRRIEVLIPETGLRRMAFLRWQNGADAGFEFTQ